MSNKFHGTLQCIKEYISRICALKYDPIMSYNNNNNSNAMTDNSTMSASSEQVLAQSHPSLADGSDDMDVNCSVHAGLVEMASEIIYESTLCQMMPFEVKYDHHTNHLLIHWENFHAYVHANYCSIHYVTHEIEDHFKPDHPMNSSNSSPPPPPPPITPMPPHLHNFHQEQPQLPPVESVKDITNQTFFFDLPDEKNQLILKMIIVDLLKKSQTTLHLMHNS